LLKAAAAVHDDETYGTLEKDMKPESTNLMSSLWYTSRVVKLAYQNVGGKNKKNMIKMKIFLCLVPSHYSSEKVVATCSTFIKWEKSDRSRHGRRLSNRQGMKYTVNMLP